MTINKSQGQTFRRTGLLLSESCFAHGQLYVAFSKCGYSPDNKNRSGLKIVVYDTPIQGRKNPMEELERTTQKELQLIISC